MLAVNGRTKPIRLQALRPGRKETGREESDVWLRGLEEENQPLIIEVPAEGDFVQVMLDALGRGIDAVRQLRAMDTARIKLSDRTVTTRKLYHPAARVMHMALFELRCDDGVYYPRLDPRKYVEGCIVIRRVTQGGQRRWGRDSLGSLSWFPVTEDEVAQTFPDPSKQIANIRTGDPELDQELAAHAPRFDEARVPMFLAPQEVCEALGRTIAYAVINTSSSEVSAAPPPFADPSALRNHVPSYLRATSGAQRVPFPNQFVSYATVTTALNSPSSGDNGLFLSFLLMLRQLVFEFGLFESAPAPASRQILTTLEKVELKFTTGTKETTQPAASFLRNAANILVLRTSSGSMQMPVEWPALTSPAATAIQQAVAQIVTARIQAIRPQEGRFANPRNRYVLRGYARVQHDPDCPPTVIASEDSDLFSIAPWFEGKGAPVPIVLPDLNLDALKQMKPNVAFAVPSALQSLLDLNDAKELADGNGKNASVQLAIDWICSFSLPVITLCAFIVLNIFLQLFNIIFQWMLWLKICIPVPRPSVVDE